MEELDLGCSGEKEPSMVNAPKSDAPKKSYPSLSIRDDAYDRFKEKFGPCEVGDEYEMTIKVKVSGVRQDEYGRSIDLQVLSVVGDTVEEESKDEAPKKGKPSGKALAEYEKEK